MAKKGGGGATQTTKTEPWSGVQPYAQDYLSNASTLYQTPYTPYRRETVAPFAPEQEAAMAMTTQRALQGSPLADEAKRNMTSTLRGQYANNNPYLDSMFGQAADRVTDQYRRGTAAQTDAAFNQSGAFGGSAYNEMVGANNRAYGDALGGLASNIYGDNYQQERDRQMQAASMAPGLAADDYTDFAKLASVGDARQGLASQYMGGAKDMWDQSQQWPYQQLDRFGNAVSVGMGGGSTTTAPNPNQSSPIAGAIGGAQAGAGISSMLGYAGPWGMAAGAALGLLGG